MGNCQDVKIIDVNMSFTSMVVFMVKWSVAAIPAMLILLLAGEVSVQQFLVEFSVVCSRKTKSIWL